MKKAPKLSAAERSELQILHEKGYSARKIARVLGRSPNTIATELKRNSFCEDGRTPPEKQGTYSAEYAKQKAYVRRKYARYQGKKIQEDNELRSYVTCKLKAGWNPDEISGAMKREKQPFYVSKTALYEWLYSAWGQQHCRYLPSRQYRPKKRAAGRATRTMIPDRVSVAERPVAALDRREAGHCEFDSVVSSRASGSAYALAVVQERSTRLVRAKLVPNLRPGHYAETIAELVGGLKTCTLTTDNGIENRAHHEITKQTGAPVCFTNSYNSWQKGWRGKRQQDA
jgi:transposase, IS30 family